MDLNNLQFYSAMGWPMFPCSSKTKAPLTAHGFKDATTNLDTLTAWHQQFPGCAWGVATSAERGVIDIDPRHGGDATLAGLIAEHGPMPLTPKVRTGGGGEHYFVTFPSGTGSGKVAPGIDRKAEGGYVIVAPSKIDIPEHQGRAYAWTVKPWECPLAPAPSWAIKAASLAAAPRGKVGGAEGNPWIVQASGDDLLTHPGSLEGERRRTLVRLAGTHLARGDSEPSIMAMAKAWAGRCDPAFTEWEKHVLGLMAKDRAKGLSHTTPSPPPATHLRATWTMDCSDSVVPEGRKEGSISPEPDPEADFLPSFPAGEDDASSPESIPSFPPSQSEEGQGGGDALSADWHTLPAEAYHGLLGEMLHAITPETEADPSGVFLAWLACFGNVVGRGAWVNVGPRKHYPGLYVGIVGKTSDAKGDSGAAALWPFREAEPAWASKCIANGIGSGEGLMEKVGDDLLDKDGKAKVNDKRCLIRLGELSRCFKVARREGATLSELLREAWDGEPIQVLNREKNGSALSASGYAVSLIGDITPGAIRKVMESGTEAFDGTANRIIWGAVRSPRDIPDGGNIEVLRPYLERLRDALAFGKTAGEVKRDAEANALWHDVYGTLKRSGDSVPHTDRARPYVVRLSLLYALADRSAVIRREHLRAALAVWSYCRESARLIFGGQVARPPAEAQPDPLWLKILNTITDAPGIDRTGLLRGFRSASAGQMEETLKGLEAQRLAHRRLVETGGRSAECWYPGPGAGGDGHEDYNTLSPLSDPPPVSAESDGKEGRKEGSPGPTSPEGEILPSFLPSDEARVAEETGGVVVPEDEALDPGTIEFLALMDAAATEVDP